MSTTDGYREEERFTAGTGKARRSITSRFAEAFGKEWPAATRLQIRLESAWCALDARLLSIRSTGSGHR